MSEERLLDALEFIDDDMIESVNVLRKYPERHKHLWLNYLAVAACIMLAIFGGFKYLGNNVSTENNSLADSGSTGNTNEMQNEAADMFGDAANKEQNGDSGTLDNNSSIRDEVGGSTGNSSNAGSSVDVSWHYAPIYLEITEISENSFKGRVIKQIKVGGETHFEKNQVVTVIYRQSENADYDTLLIKDLSVGEKVYVIYGEPDTDTIYTSYIRYDDKF